MMLGAGCGSVRERQESGCSRVRERAEALRTDLERTFVLVTEGIWESEREEVQIHMQGFLS